MVIFLKLLRPHSADAGEAPLPLLQKSVSGSRWKRPQRPAGAAPGTRTQRPLTTPLPGFKPAPGCTGRSRAGLLLPGCPATPALRPSREAGPDPAPRRRRPPIARNGSASEPPGATRRLFRPRRRSPACSPNPEVLLASPRPLRFGSSQSPSRLPFRPVPGQGEWLAAGSARPSAAIRLAGSRRAPGPARPEWRGDPAPGAPGIAGPGGGMRAQGPGLGEGPGLGAGL